MKLQILLITLLPFIGFSQVTVNDFNLNNPDNGIYIVDIGVGASMFASKCYILYPGVKKNKKLAQVIKGANGEQLDSIDELEILNFMERNGWEYLTNLNNSPSGFKFRFRRKESK
jgi:hypothetical protein